MHNKYRLEHHYSNSLLQKSVLNLCLIAEVLITYMDGLHWRMRQWLKNSTLILSGLRNASSGAVMSHLSWSGSEIRRHQSDLIGEQRFVNHQLIKYPWGTNLFVIKQRGLKSWCWSWWWATLSFIVIPMAAQDHWMLLLHESKDTVFECTSHCPL